MSESATVNPPARAPKGQAADPYEQPVQYLLSRGWRPDGEARRPQTRWLDPTKPVEATEHRVKIGQKKLPGGKVEDVFQLVHTPAAWPMSRDEALAEQLRRDEAAKAR